MILRQIQLKNFLSHDHSTVDFSPTAKILVDGMSGAGKSSIVDAIIWCLYGEGRTQGRSLIRKGQSSASVVLEVVSGKTYYKITRSLTNKGVHKLEVEEKTSLKGKYMPIPTTGIKAVQDWITKDLVGASYLLFVNSVAYLQEGSELFVSQPANKRKDLLLEIIRAEDYDAYYEKAKDKLSELSNKQNELTNEVTSSEGAIAAITTGLGDKKTLEKDVSSLEKEVAVAQADVDLAQELSTKYQTALQEVAALDFQLRQEKNNLDTLRTKIAKEDDLRKELEGAEERKAVLQTRKAVLAVDTESLNTQLRAERESFAGSMKQYEEAMANKPNMAEAEELRMRITNSTNEIKHLNEGGVCPSGSQCPFMAGRTESVAYLASLIATNTIALTALDNQINEWCIKYGSLSRPVYDPAREGKIMFAIATNDKEAQLIDTELSRLEHATKDLKPAGFYAPDLLILEATVGDLDRQRTDKNEALGAFNGRLMLPALTTTLVEKKSKLAASKLTLERIEAAEGEIKRLQKKIIDNKNDLVSILSQVEKVAAVKEAFGPKGVRSVVIDYLIPQLEERVNTILSRLSDFTIRFDTQAEKVDGGAKEGLFITIINDVGEELPYEAFSGGEKLKITVAISEALASLQKVQFRLFDEMFVGLDADSTDNFSMVLERLQEKFPQVICISHLQQIKDMFQEHVMVTKHNGISKINQTV